MLDKCISLCAKFPGEELCSICRIKANMPPKLKKRVVRHADGTVEIERTLDGHRVRQRFENRTWKYMRVKSDPKQHVMRLPQSLRDFMRAHIVRK